MILQIAVSFIWLAQSENYLKVLFIKRILRSEFTFMKTMFDDLNFE